MAVFAYRATSRTSDGLVVKGTIAADTPRQARDLLRARGLAVHDLICQQSQVVGKSTELGSWLTFRRSARNPVKLATTIRELATLLGVGIPLLEALDTISKQHVGSFHTSLVLLRDRIAAGAALAEAMNDQPDVYDSLCIHMVEVGENAGNLDRVLEQLAEFKEKSLELKDRIFTALLYPTIVLTASIGVTVFLMTVVVPMLLTNLLEAGRPLPLPTRILKMGSDILLLHGWWLTILCIAGIIGASIALRTERGKRHWHRLLLKIPVLGDMARKEALSRIAMVVATLMKSGIVFLKALEIAKRSTRNVILSDAMSRMCEAVLAGQEIGPAMEATTAFPPLVVQVFSVGQQTGRMEEMLERLATDYDRQVSSLSSRLATVLEPILILLLAVFVGFILFATVLPILEAGNVL